ncbi:MAG TPA: tRNA (N6-threonylcarbamoyladenosine(37)-N6)-methyltransferase TrmO [Bacteroides sp.]|nr:tRNA (N6-threonylcarbamoyladenosine(37)-N6)-methyltransferase TrmO [Bacteroides sp.]
MKRITYSPIGVIHSPYKKPEGTPIQPGSRIEVAGTVEVFDKFAEGLKDLEGFSHIILVCHFHLVSGYELQVFPFMDDREHGVFATRSPRRPNPIGISVVRLDGIEKNILRVSHLDIVDGTPVLDLKPHVSRFDAGRPERIGWLEDHIQKLRETKDDGRFTP